MSEHSGPAMQYRKRYKIKYPDESLGYFILTLYCGSGTLSDMGLEDFMKNQLIKREVRGRSPAFQAEMKNENAEFGTILKDLGKNTFDMGVTGILKAPTSLFLNALKVTYDKKYGMNDYGNDALKLFFSKDGVAHNTAKVVANAAHLVGKGLKIGTRQLLKI